MKEDRGQMMEFGSWNAEVGKKELRIDYGIRKAEFGNRWWEVGKE
jgi:hypothetical protein